MRTWPLPPPLLPIKLENRANDQVDVFFLGSVELPMMKTLGMSLLAGLVTFSVATLSHGQRDRELEDITGRYSFLKPDDLLGILDEDGELRGFIEVFQEDEESDELFTYTIARGSREGDQVRFKTDTIHGTTYRFSGKVQVSRERKPNQRGYMLLVGILRVETRVPSTGGEKVEEKKVVLESLASE